MPCHLIPETLSKYFILPPIDDVFDLPDGHIVQLSDLLKRQAMNKPVDHDLTISDVMNPVKDQQHDFRVRIIIFCHLLLILPVP